jgi:hypothetical protein
MVRNSLALLPMRWVSITSWPTADSSAGEAPCCSFSDDTVSADLQQIGRLAVDVAQRLADLGQRLLLRQHGLRVLLGAVDQRQQRVHELLQRARHGGTRTRTVLQLRTLRASMAALSFTSGKAVRRPAGPATPTWPAAATASAPGRRRPPGTALRLAASAPAAPLPGSCSTMPRTAPTSSTRCWRAVAADGRSAAAARGVASKSPGGAFRCIRRQLGRRGLGDDRLSPSVLRRLSAASVTPPGPRRTVSLHRRRGVHHLVERHRRYRLGWRGAGDLPLILSRKLMEVLSRCSYGVCRGADAAMPRNNAPAGQRGEVDLQPGTPGLVRPGPPANRGRGPSAAVGPRVSWRGTAQPGQAVDDQRAWLPSAGFSASTREASGQGSPAGAARAGPGSRRGRPRRAGHRADWPRRRTRAGCAAPASTRHGEDLAGGGFSGNSRPWPSHSTASQAERCGTRLHRLQPFGQPALEFAQGFAAWPSASRALSRRRGSWRSARRH